MSTINLIRAEVNILPRSCTGCPFVLMDDRDGECGIIQRNIRKYDTSRHPSCPLGLAKTEEK